MYLAEYDEGPQMGGLFKSLKKVVKKVVKPVAHIGAAVITGGASIPISAQLFARAKAAKDQQAQAQRDAAEFDRQAAVLKSLQTPAPVAAVAPAAAPAAIITATAPTAAAVQAAVSQAQPAPMLPTIPTFAPITPAYDQPFTERATTQPVRARAASTMPSWAIPAGVGVAALVAVFAVAGGRRK